MQKKIVSVLILSYITVISVVLPGINTMNAANSDMSSTGYMINVSDLSPGEKSASTETASPKEIINGFLEKITQLLLIVIPALASVFIVVGGIKMITSGGDSSKISSAKNIITYNIIAVVIALLSYSIIQLIVWLLGSTS